MDSYFNDSKIAFEYRSDRDLQLSKLIYSVISSPSVTNTGIAITQAALMLGLPVNTIFKKTLFKQFCGGISLDEAGSTAKNLLLYNVQTILDYGVEGKSGDSDFENTTLYLANAVRYAAENKIPFISIKITGMGRFALLEKVHQKLKLTHAEENEWKLLVNRADTVCSMAANMGVMVLIDAEETWIQDAVNIITEEMMQKYNRTSAVVFNTFQLYCKGTLEFLKTSFIKANVKGYILGAKLVRGAYMEKERARAKKYNYPSPIQEDKFNTDKDFNEAVKFCLGHITELSLFIGTHNEESCRMAVTSMKEMNLAAGHPHVYFSQLYGMSDNISFNLAHSGYNVAKYLPYGPVKEVIPYLLRRAKENSSIVGQSGRELNLIKTEITRRNRRR